MKKAVEQLFDSHRAHCTDSPLKAALTSIYLFDFLDRLRQQNFPQSWFSALESGLCSIGETFDVLASHFDIKGDFASFSDKHANAEFEEKTGSVYFHLFRDFSKEEYFAEATRLLNERFQKNEISVDGINTALDDGCGGGRYTLALKKLGVQKVTGIDISRDSVAFAQSKSPFASDEVQFVQGSVLDLPFEPESFDFVFSNGVLHHTLSTEKGLQEIYRVLKPNGQCWLYLYGGKDSLFWDIVDYCRSLLKNVPQSYTQSLMRVMGYPPGRIFHRNDFFYVPVNRRYFAAETEQMIGDANFSDCRRLKRGASADWDEIIFQNPHLDPYIYGEGEMRYLIRK